jgi:myo-inositol-1(or 4)-monophosphatase
MPILEEPLHMPNARDHDRSLLHHARDVAVTLAKEAGETQRAALQDGNAIHFKGAVDLVTDADISSERIISSGIMAEFPKHRLTGEEGATGSVENGYRWLIDPIDGTTNFAHGQPHWAVSICLEHEGTPVMGVVYDVPKREMFTTVIGEGAFLNNRPIQVTGNDQLIQSMGATGFSYDVDERENSYRLWEVFNDRARAMRRNGAAALDMVWVACGRLDFYFERPVNNWDVSAGVIICREAGGKVTRLDGAQYEIEDREVCVSNGRIHDQVVRIIRETLHNR